jgi:asparagine synthetase B (glutamine-hydrolysing)
MEWNGKAAAMHGLEMAFPFLDRDLLSYQLATPGDMQVRNGVPKVLLREAMNGIVPDAIAWRSSKADFTEVVNAGLADDCEQVIRSLTGPSRAAQMGYLAMGHPVEHGLPSRTSETILASRRLVDLFALEMWLQEWFPGNRHLPRGDA